jgi:hypothetical protein
LEKGHGAENTAQVAARYFFFGFFFPAFFFATKFTSSMRLYNNSASIPAQTSGCPHAFLL